ncbi:MAG: condensation domain-containing protein, partial [Bradymonadaceae bacterium]
GFLAAFAAQRALTVGVPVTQRRRPELRQLIGFFLNTVPMGVEIEPGRDFASWLRDVRRQWRQSTPHRWIPLDEIVDAVGAERTGGQLPLFDVMFTYLPDEYGSQRLGDLHLEPMRDVRVPEAQCTLNVAVTSTDEHLRGRFDYDASRFDRGDVER